MHEPYDLADDPYELENRAGNESYRDVQNELDRALMAWMDEVDDPILEGPIRTPYYGLAMADFLGH